MSLGFDASQDNRLISNSYPNQIMSLRERIPDPLKIGDSMISIAVEGDVAVFPTSEYILLEISHKAGRVNIPKIVGTIRSLVKEEQRMVAIRGFGFKGIGLAVRIAHELKIGEEQFTYQMTFDTFDATDPQDDNLVTSVQIIVLPPA